VAAADLTDEVPVVIAGAGPAGLVAAVTLARNGIGSLLVERNPGLSPLPRAIAVSTRTMEPLRSWGLEEEVRAGQLTIDSTGAWAAETLASSEGVVVPLGIADLEEIANASPATPAAVPQDHLEPVLLRHLEILGLAEVRFGTELIALDQDADASPWCCGSGRAAPSGPSGPATWSARTAPTRGRGASSASPWTAPTT
jgi:putative polyketide hydroxylase